MGGWLEIWEVKLISTQVVVEVEVWVELGNKPRRTIDPSHQPTLLLKIWIKAFLNRHVELAFFITLKKKHPVKFPYHEQQSHHSCQNHTLIAESLRRPSTSKK